VILLDSNILNALVNGLFFPKQEYRIGAVTLGECLRGTIIHPEDETLRRLAALVDAVDDGTILPYGPEEARVFARIAGRVTARKRIPDLMIAATAIVAGLPLVTFDTGLEAVARDLAASGPPDLALVVQLLDI